MNRHMHLLTLFSCNTIERKGNAIAIKTEEGISKTKEKINRKKNNLLDRIFPIYDHGKSDTENNKKRFREHLQVDPTSDVEDIYSYADFMGIDYMVIIAFRCDTATLNHIVKVKKMALSNADYDHGLTFSAQFPWWDKEAIQQIKPYRVGTEYEYWEYLWYDHKTKLAYYEEFSL